MRLHHNLFIAYWNIDGLFRRIDGQRICKLSDDKFLNSISPYDIVCLVETHCGPNESLAIPGYHIMQNFREKSLTSTRYYGGIAICVKSEIYKGIQIMPIKNSEILWIKLCKSFFNLECDIYMAVTYISPSGSPFAGRNDNIFEILESDIAKYSQVGDCIICGDFNARTGVEPDYCMEDENPVTDSIPEYICDTPLKRSNMDNRSVDGHGVQLLDLCKSTSLRILNGRTVGDFCGRCTCYSYSGQPSVIDYFLAAQSILDKFDYFYVHEPNDLSIHCMLSCTIGNIAHAHAQEDVRTHLHSKWFWAEGDNVGYAKALSQPEISTRIGQLLETDRNLTSVDQAVSSLQDIMIDAAKIAKIHCRNLNKKASKKKGGIKHKKWVDP